MTSLIPRTCLVAALLLFATTGCDVENSTVTDDDDTASDDDVATDDDSGDDDSMPVDGDGDGYTGDVDCDDGNPEIHPGADEVCDAVDNDCDGLVDDEDDDVDAPVYFGDADHDGFGAGQGTATCQQPSDSSELDGDCDDEDDDVFPGAPDVCDGVEDNDCDGTSDPLESDDDGDGDSECDGDCDDDDPDLNVADGDGDGVHTCAGDCDDADPAVYPGAPDTCDGVADNDCDGVTDPQEADGDGDGASACGGDCDDDNPGLNVADGDGDGVHTCAGDCDDANPTVFPAAPEVCDGVADNDCDGTPDPLESDDDGDGDSECDGDCDDGEPFLNVQDDDGDGATTCSGDCDDQDGTVENLDLDGDGASTCDGDCDDGDATTWPGAPENECDGVDNDCSGDTEWLVPTDFAVIQDAIDTAAHGDTICVSAGQYVENLDMMGKGVHLLGWEGPEVTVLDGGGVDRVLSIVSAEGPDTVIEGFTITNGSANFEGGGGIRIDTASPTLENLIVTSNFAWGEGGGVMMIHCESSVRDVVISFNETPETGAGMEIEGDSYPLIDNSWFLGNVADRDGGGVHVNGSEPVFRNVVFAHNEADNGGGLNIHTHTVSAPRLENVAFLDNTAVQNGGGIRLIASETTMYNVSVVANHADQGGGIFLRDTPSTHVNLIVTGNSGGSGGGGIHVDSGSTDIQYSDVWDNTGGDYQGTPDPTGSDGNLSVDPLFLDATSMDVLDWDLHLSTMSPLVDTGDPGILDPDGGSSDMGLYGGPHASAWDRDVDGYYDWWLPGPYPGGGWDCDDLDETVYPGSGC